MEDLPTPLSRIECYLAVAAGMAGVTLPEKPESRLEQFLAVIAGDTSVTLPTPLSLTELWLAYVAGEPLTDEMKLVGAYWIGPQKVDVRFFAVAGGMDGVVVPTPQNRTEQYWAKIAEIRPIHGVLKYATGTVINLTDVVSGLESLEIIYGDTTQQTYSGKNLSPVEPGTYVSADLTYEVSADGTVTINGTSTAVSARNLTATFPITLAAGQTYILSASNPVANSNVIVRLMDENGNPYSGSAMNLTGVNKYTAITPTNDSTPLRVQIRIDSGVSLTNFVVKPMVEKGSSPSAFESYVGGVPAPNPSYPQNINVVTGTQTVGVTGKNLFDINDFSATGITVENDIATGTSSAFNTAFGTNGVSLSLPEGKYTISITGYTDGNQSTEATSGLGFRVKYSDGTYSSYVYWQNADTTAVTKTLTTLDSKTPTGLIVSFGAKGQNIWHLSKVQIEQGSATTYEPYQGANYNVDLTSKNILNFGSGTYGVSVVFNNGNATETHDANSVVMEATGTVGAQYVRWITGELDSTKTYYLSFKAKKIVKGTDGEPIIQIIRYGSNDLSAWTNLGSTGTVVATPVEGTEYSLGAALSGYKYYRFYIYNNANTPVTVGEKTAYYDIQLELGSATPYVPYMTPIELCKMGTYQDYIYKSGDDWYVHKETGKTVLTGDEPDWSSTALTTGRRYYLLSNDLGLPNRNGTTGDMVSDNFINIDYATYYSVGGVDGISFSYFNTNHYVQVFFQTAFASVNAFKTWLGTHNTTVYYALATPTDTKITDGTLIGQLNALDTAVIPKPNANLIVTGNLAGAIKISYMGEEE